MYGTLRETSFRTRRLLLSGTGQHLRRAREIWALRDVSFDVRGEVLGIIGRNGAGKTTLLKVLSRITTPTHGRVEIRGRVGSLLEVGTGFHPELTGRENIYLNGAILGMKRRRSTRKFDEIVDFSGVERFIDTPVKRYSSGMYVRLAFAVAAHLEPEILIVDEVLAVGEPSSRAMPRPHGALRQTGRTVLFVSHNMQALGRAALRPRDPPFQERPMGRPGRSSAADVVARYSLQTSAGAGSESHVGRRRRTRRRLSCGICPLGAHRRR